MPDRIICTQLALPCSALITPPLDLVTLRSTGTPLSRSAPCRLSR
ncbi:Uncharacterised protein [Bordetella pertussis]|nr:Uncharacterised protein [Bordetella pertussis]CFP62619.1 Uncharacterised protein [Bordetella pertussis]CPL51571.1 Uncharacterised protein [Bordetella pertussis]